MAQKKMQKIRKAIIPVAGMGTRFLPATKAQPKEMLAVVDKPVIQYIVEEAVAAGIEEIIFVTAMGKRALEDHFDRNFELEYRLEQKKKMAELKTIQAIGKLAKFAFVRQQKPLGDGHALLAAAPFVGADETVAIFTGDDIFSGDRPAIAELMETYEKFGAPVVGIQEVPHDKVSSYGIIDGVEVAGNTWQVKRFVEKPDPADAPSNLASVGRYIVTPDILRLLEKQKPGKDGEIRLADAFTSYVDAGKQLYGQVLTGKRYDCGNKLQFIIAQIELGLLHPEVKDGLAEYLSSR